MNKPKLKLKEGNIVVTLWENNNDQLHIWETITVERIYKDKEGNWSSTQTIRKDEIDKVINILQKIRQEEIQDITPK